MAKVTWQDVYNNFKSIYPNLSKLSQRFTPLGYMTIKIYLEDGTNMIYDDLKKQACWTSNIIN